MDYLIYMDKNKEYGNLKVLLDTLKKFKKAKNLAEFKSEEKITVSEFFEELLEPYFRKFDNLKIEKRE